MLRTACALVALVAFVGFTAGADTDPGRAVKAQMVKGTIKSADATTGVLVINQKVGNTAVDRELSITAKVMFSITTKDGTEEVFGKDALRILEGAKGATVQVKCDKDVNVISVTVRVAK